MPEISELIHIGCLVFVLFSFRVAFAIGSGKNGEIGVEACNFL